MRISFNQVKDQEATIPLTLSDSWAAHAVDQVDENIDVISPERHLKNRTLTGELVLRRVDDVVVISGKIHTQVQLICSRCAKHFSYPIHNHFTALFSKDPAMAGVGHIETHGPDQGKPVGQNRGFARHAHDGFIPDPAATPDLSDFGQEDSSEDKGNTGQDLDITYISGDTIDLADVVAEQLRLTIPFQPLCKEDCKGMCPQCGADWNVGRCACAKISQENPFSVLKKLKLKN